MIAVSCRERWPKSASRAASSSVLRASTAARSFCKFARRSASDGEPSRRKAARCLLSRTLSTSGRVALDSRGCSRTAGSPMLRVELASSADIVMTPSRSDRRARSTKIQQVGIETIFESGRKSVAGAFVNLQRRPIDDLRGQQGRCRNRHDLIVVAVDDERRDVDLPEVVCQVGLGEDLDAVIGVLETGLHAEQPERVENTLGHGRTRAVGAEECDAQVLEEL